MDASKQLPQFQMSNDKESRSNSRLNDVEDTDSSSDSVFVLNDINYDSSSSSSNSTILPFLAEFQVELSYNEIRTQSEHASESEELGILTITIEDENTSGELSEISGKSEQEHLPGSQKDVNKENAIYRNSITQIENDDPTEQQSRFSGKKMPKEQTMNSLSNLSCHVTNQETSTSLVTKRNSYENSKETKSELILSKKRKLSSFSHSKRRRISSNDTRQTDDEEMSNVGSVLEDKKSKNLSKLRNSKPSQSVLATKKVKSSSFANSEELQRSRNKSVDVDDNNVELWPCDLNDENSSNTFENERVETASQSEYSRKTNRRVYPSQSILTTIRGKKSFNSRSKRSRIFGDKSTHHDDDDDLVNEQSPSKRRRSQSSVFFLIIQWKKS